MSCQSRVVGVVKLWQDFMQNSGIKCPVCSIDHSLASLIDNGYLVQSFFHRRCVSWRSLGCKWCQAFDSLTCCVTPVSTRRRSVTEGSSAVTQPHGRVHRSEVDKVSRFTAAAHRCAATRSVHPGFFFSSRYAVILFDQRCYLYISCVLMLFL